MYTEQQFGWIITTQCATNALRGAEFSLLLRDGWLAGWLERFQISLTMKATATVCFTFVLCSISTTTTTINNNNNNPSTNYSSNEAGRDVYHHHHC